jgi:hypothetical protein
MDGLRVRRLRPSESGAIAEVLGAENQTEFVPVSPSVAAFVQVELTRAQATYGNLPICFPTPDAIFVPPERLND